MMRSCVLLASAFCCLSPEVVAAPAAPSCLAFETGYAALSATFPIVPAIDFGAPAADGTRQFGVGPLAGTLACDDALNFRRFEACLGRIGDLDLDAIERFRLMVGGALVATGLSIEAADAVFEDMRRQAQAQMLEAMANAAPAIEAVGTARIPTGLVASYAMFGSELNPSVGRVCLTIEALDTQTSGAMG